MQYRHLDTPVSPLRERLIDDMNLRRFSRETQRNYLRDIGRVSTGCAAHASCSAAGREG